ncbi:MAG: hypothetical protein ABIJ45_08175 [Candidatus Zixiibacteriota bacterium]
MNLSFHFNIEIDPDRKIIISKIYGIWKKETAIEFREEYNKTAQPLLKGKWAKITNLANWKSSYPEIIEILGEHLHWCHENGAEYTAYAIEDPVTTRQLMALIEKSKVADKVSIFKTFKEADKFLQQKGY